METARKPLAQLFHKLLETRWFFTFTASCTATIVGISLTFGINSCRETRHMQQDARDSILEAVESLHDRGPGLAKSIDVMMQQDSLFNVIYKLHRHNEAIPDSLADNFIEAITSGRFNLSDRSIEKIFNESYQLWQALDQDALTKLIRADFILTNEVSNYCDTHTEQLYQHIEQYCPEAYTSPDNLVAINKILNNEQFCCYMEKRHMLTPGFKMVINNMHEEILSDIDSLCAALGYTKPQEAYDKEYNYDTNVTSTN